jgi:uncharacterized protein YaeQ
MALKSLVHKLSLTLSDMDRHHYGDYQLTIAQHPSENDHRLMLRILAFALNASDTLSFTKGLSADDEPEIWQKSLSDEIELWIDLGLPDEKRLKKACNQSKRAILYTYGDGDQKVWLEKHQGKFFQHQNLSVFSIPYEQSQQLVELVARNMQLSVTVQDGQVWLSNDTGSHLIEPKQMS